MGKDINKGQGKKEGLNKGRGYNNGRGYNKVVDLVSKIKQMAH